MQTILITIRIYEMALHRYNLTDYRITTQQQPNNKPGSQTRSPPARSQQPPIQDERDGNDQEP
jgi:hypothetical protein